MESPRVLMKQVEGCITNQTDEKIGTSELGDVNPSL